MLNLASVWMGLAERAKAEKLLQQQQKQQQPENKLPASHGTPAIAPLAPESPLPVHRKSGMFDPEEVGMLGEVFEDVIRALGLEDRADPITPS